MKPIRLLTLSLTSFVLLLTGCATKRDASIDSADSCCEPANALSLLPSPFLASHTARFGTNKIHYVTTGKGDHAIVFVHCWAGQLGFWREQVPALQDKARLVLLDLPGHGQSDKPQVDYTLDYFASAVLAVMRDAHVSRATLVGHSMGTPVICRVYTQAPQKVAALVCVDGMLRRLPTMTLQDREEFVAPFRKPDYREHTQQYIGALFSTNSAALRDAVISDLLQTPQYVMAGALDGMFGAGRPDWDPKKVKVPVICLNTTSPIWTEENRAYVRSLSPQTDYRAFDGVGHWLMLEKPAEFNAALIDMLEEFNLIAK